MESPLGEMATSLNCSKESWIPFCTFETVAVKPCELVRIKSGMWYVDAKRTTRETSAVVAAEIDTRRSGILQSLMKEKLLCLRRKYLQGSQRPVACNQSVSLGRMILAFGESLRSANALKTSKWVLVLSRLDKRDVALTTCRQAINTATKRMLSREVSFEKSRGWWIKSDESHGSLYIYLHEGVGAG